MVRRAFARSSARKALRARSLTEAMRECDIDWVSLAREQAQRKYGEPLPSAFTEKVKVQRFLLYRGYLMEDIRGNLAKFCRLTHPGFYFAVKKTYLIPTLFRRAAGCDCAGSGLGDYSFTQKSFKLHQGGKRDSLSQRTSVRCRKSKRSQDRGDLKDDV